MRIGLVSDTHIPEVERKLPAELIEALRGVELILHAGDIYTPSVLDELERIAPVLAARGDDDYIATLADERVKQKQVLKLEGQTLWLIHDRRYYFMPPWWQGRISKWWQGRISPGQDEPDSPDIVVFGHEHRAVVENLHDILFVSPGSPTFLHYRHGLGTIGILDTDSGEPDVRIVQL